VRELQKMNEREVKMFRLKIMTYMAAHVIILEQRPVAPLQGNRAGVVEEAVDAVPCAPFARGRKAGRRAPGVAVCGIQVPPPHVRAASPLAGRRNVLACGRGLVHRRALGNGAVLLK